MSPGPKGSSLFLVPQAWQEADRVVGWRRENRNSMYSEHLYVVCLFDIFSASFGFCLSYHSILICRVHLRCSLGTIVKSKPNPFTLVIHVPRLTVTICQWMLFKRLKLWLRSISSNCNNFLPWRNNFSFWWPPPVFKVTWQTLGWMLFLTLNYKMGSNSCFMLALFLKTKELTFTLAVFICWTLHKSDSGHTL